jgi:seryl-tRNA synthetase
MLDRDLLRNEPDRVREAAEAKGDACDVDAWLELDRERREILVRVEALRRRRNELSKEVSRKRRDGEDAGDLIAESRETGEAISGGDEELRHLDSRMTELELRFPNIPDEDVPRGASEADNRIVRSHGDQPSFDFTPRPHWELLGDHMDQEAAGRIAGSNYILFRGWPAELQRRLISWMLDFHSRDGMEEVWAPFVACRESMLTTAQIPKLESDMYSLEGDDLFLVPTGEVPITGIFRDQLLDESDLPVRLCGYTPCFRREAGSYGKDTRGLNRVHQFEKVEFVRIEHPDRSGEALEEMVAHAESMLRALELPYRVSLLATGDLSFAAARCYDLEIWSAGQEKWLEVSSVSNFRDFQARRGSIRFRPSGGGKPRFVHTLNGSGLALPRLISALIENNQTGDGTVVLPDILADIMNRKEFAPED